MDLPLSERIKRIERSMNISHEEESTPEYPKIKKGLWIPFKAKVGRRKARKGWVIVQKIQDNRDVVFEKQKVEDETIIVDGVPRMITPDETLHYKNKPFVILPSWSVKPFSPTDNFESTQAKEYGSKGHKLLLARMMGEVISAKKKVSLVIVFIIIIALIAGGYFLMKSGAFN